MDPLQSNEIDDNVDNENATIVTSSNSGATHIELEGSHTTSTETDSSFSINKKNVTFVDEEEEEEVDKQNFKPQTTSTPENEEKIKTQPDIECSEREEHIREEDKTESCGVEAPPIASELTQQDLLAVASLKNQIENAQVIIELPSANDVQNKAAESEEISQQFEKIIDIFDSFAKNLGSLDFVTNSNARKRPKNEWPKDQLELEEPLKHRRRYEDCLAEDQIKPDFRGSQPLDPAMPTFASTGTSCTELLVSDPIEDYCMFQQVSFKETKNGGDERKTITARSVSTTTANYELKSFGCQTQHSDHISINEVSLLDGSSLTSRSEQPNSLNNYAQAENACNSCCSTQPEATKKPLLETLVEQTLTSPTVTQETSTTPPFSVITIEANSPSSTDFRRPPFCQRLWQLIGDFCAATFLCLQVNKDCIFCLGFFAAFVVSASFLTAFFYHTLIISQSLWQVEGNPQY